MKVFTGHSLVTNESDCLHLSSVGTMTPNATCEHAWLTSWWGPVENELRS